MELDTYRALIYYRQSVVCQWLDSGNRVIPCLRHRVPNHETIDVVQRGARAKYSGLQICRMTWLCPACASKVARERRRGMKRAIDHMTGASCELVFVTYTVRHRIDDPLAQVAGWVLNAHRAMHSGKAWKTIEKQFGWQGSIKACEVLYGNNGWHFHLHEIGFVDASYECGSLQNILRDRWSTMLRAGGASADHDIGLQVKPARSSVRDYVSKWGIVPELASGIDKKSRRGGILPFQFPDASMDITTDKSPYRKLFNEYAAATKGLKQISASPSVRPFLRDDVDVRAEPSDQIFEALASLTIDQWRAIRKQGLRAKLLEAAEAGELDRFLKVIENYQ